MPFTGVGEGQPALHFTPPSPPNSSGINPSLGSLVIKAFCSVNQIDSWISHCLVTISYFLRLLITIIILQSIHPLLVLENVTGIPSFCSPVLMFMPLKNKKLLPL